MKRVAIALLLIATAVACGGKEKKAARAAAKAAAIEGDVVESGWVWVSGERPAVSAKTTPGSASKGWLKQGGRVAYRKRFQAGGKTTHFWVVPAGGAEGWVAASGVSRKRLAPAAKPAAPPRVLAQPAAGAPQGGMVSTNRLDSRALTTVEAGAATTADEAASDLASLQAYVDTVFAQKNSATSEQIKAGREADAAAFQKGIP